MQAIQIMSALAQPTRLQVFSELARAGDLGLPAGAIADATGTPANTMSAHLAILSRAGLVTSEREGRNIVYKIATGSIRELVSFLAHACSGGDEDRYREFLDGLGGDAGLK